jgi:transposase-like protein/IS1 family transposase
MVISSCKHDCFRKDGTDRHGIQRYKCSLCGKRWSESQPKVLGNMRIGLELAERIIKCLCEGVSVRATSRLCGVDPYTVIDLMLLVGRRCKVFLADILKDVPVADVQVDEAWQFIYCKAKTAKVGDFDADAGDSYLYTAIERNSKLMLAWHLGKRDQWNTDTFCQKLANATAGRFQLSSDGWQPYPSAVIRALGHRVSLGVLVKIFGKTQQDDARKYSPAPIIGIKKEAAWNLPDRDKICTSHVERQNLNLRTFIRRMTRLSNGFSKKWANHEAMVALYIAHYNFCRVHGTIKTTPAVASGVAPSKWTVRMLLEKTAPQ